MEKNDKKYTTIKEVKKKTKILVHNKFKGLKWELIMEEDNVEYDYKMQAELIEWKNNIFSELHI
jgi:hypothetical protein